MELADEAGDGSSDTDGPALDPLPLAGIRVIEAGRFASAPSCATVLADWGADVIKLEPLAGDPARGPGSLGATNPRFEVHNRSRRSLGLDLDLDAAWPVFRRLVESADVFVSNMRPLALARLGIDPAALLAMNDRLVVGQITGFPLSTDEVDRASYDHGAFWAYSGMADSFTPCDAAPPQPAGGMGDRMTGMALAGAIAAALLRRETTGRGGHVTTSLTAAGVWALASDVADALHQGDPTRSTDRTETRHPTLNCFRAGDGRWFWLQLMLPEERWKQFLDAIDAAWLDDDPRFAGGEPARLARSAPALVETLDEIFRLRPLDEWRERLVSRDIPFAEVRSVAEVAADASLRAAGLVVSVGDDGFASVGSPCTFEDTAAVEPRRAPSVGEHDLELLRELGFDDADIEQLVLDGAVEH